MAGIFNILLVIVLAAFSLVAVFGWVLVPVYCFMVFSGASKRITKAQKSLDDTLMQDEVLIAQGMQQRPFALFHRRKLVAITSSRIIVISRGILGGFTMQDFQWKDLHNAKISENVLSSFCGSNLTFSAFDQVISVPGVENGAATTIYKKSQAEEQAWEEKRRVRDLEERRASAGGVVVNSGAPNSGSKQVGSGSVSIMEEIEKAKKLLDSGAINDAEFQEIKSKILSKNY